MDGQRNSLRTEDILVNHVLSNDVQSAIFNDIFDYFIKYSSPGVSYAITPFPVETADVYHYHRPHLETSLRRKSIVTVHHDLDDIDAWLAFEKLRTVYHNVYKIVCLNSYQRDWLKERGYYNTIVIPHGYDNNLLQQKNSSYSTRKICLGLASKRYLRRVKGEAVFLETVKRLSPELFSFFLIGSGRAQEADILSRMGFEVTVYEYLPYRLFQQFYETIDALLIYSWFEGGPACLPEAVAIGIPLFSTKVGMAHDYLIPGSNGYFLSRDPQEDARLLTRFAEDKNFMTDLVRGAVEQGKKIPTWEKIITRYMEIYYEVASL